MDDTYPATFVPKTTTHLVHAVLQQKLTIIGQDRKQIGTLDQFIVDMHSGQIRYVILSMGGFLGIGQKYHPLPFSHLHASPEALAYMVDIDRVLVDGSPSYRVDDAPVFDEQYGKRIDRYYPAGSPAI